ncbi:MAG: hypothetical protein QXL94_07925 [Candidatus Parvarchaeum sp.]
MDTKCIYCLNNGQSSKEHVVLNAFTQGIRENLTIKNVCSSCNQYFGDKIDIMLARQDPYKTIRDLKNFHGIILKGNIDPHDPTGRAIHRAITKIGFNYAAKVTENLGLNSPVYNGDFDRTRKFILTGEDPGYGTLIVPYMWHQTKTIKHHILSIDIVRPESEWLFVVYVELYNTLRFQVTLSKNYQGICLPNLARSHIFDLEQKVCFPTNPQWVMSRA